MEPNDDDERLFSDLLLGQHANATGQLLDRLDSLGDGDDLVGLDAGSVADANSSLAPSAEGDGVEWDFHLSFEFAVHGVLLCAVGTLGLIGNLFSIIILSRPQMKSSINTLLIGLVSCDSLLIVTSICLFSFTNFRHAGSSVFSLYYWYVYPYILPFVYPVGLIAQTGSAYMTLGVTIERYFVVCWPLKSRSVCTNGRAKTAVLSFVAFAAVYNIPRFLEVTWTTEYFPEFAENRTTFVVTDLRMNPIYISVYVTWMYLVFMYIVPFASLAVLNLLIFLEIRKANVTRSLLSNQEKKEHNLAVMLLVVVLIFFICNISALIINILELSGTKNQQFIQISNLLVTINSSVNFLVYCIFGNKFKTLFMQIFCGRKPRMQTMRTGLELRRSQHESMSYRRNNRLDESSMSTASVMRTTNGAVMGGGSSSTSQKAILLHSCSLTGNYSGNGNNSRQQQQEMRKERVASAMRTISNKSSNVSEGGGVSPVAAGAGLSTVPNGNAVAVVHNGDGVIPTASGASSDHVDVVVVVDEDKNGAVPGVGPTVEEEMGRLLEELAESEELNGNGRRKGSSRRSSSKKKSRT